MPIPAGGPVDPSRMHALAIHDLLRAAVPVEVDVYNGRVDKADADLTWPYLVVWSQPGTRDMDSLAGYTGGGVRTVTQVTAAGTTVDEVLAWLDRAAGALHGVCPIIAGRDCGLIGQLPGTQPPQPRPDPRVKTAAGNSILFSFALFGLFSTPAA